MCELPAGYSYAIIKLNMAQMRLEINTGRHVVRRIYRRHKLYYSCLFPTRESETGRYVQQMPEYFRDLNLDQIASCAMAEYEKFDIAKHYYTILRDEKTISYRQEAMREMENEQVLQAARDLCEIVVAVSRLLPKLENSLKGQGPMENNAMTKGSFLNAAVKYIVAVQTFAEKAKELDMRSGALHGFAGYLEEMFQKPEWQAFLQHVVRVRGAFDEANYCLLIKNSTIRLRKYEGQEDEGEYVRRLFEKFAQGQTQEYRHKINENAIAYHVESALLELLVKMYPDEFKDLAELCKQHAHFLDATVERFAMEMQFYFSYIDYIAPIRRRGMLFCYPAFVGRGERVEAAESFDLALAHNRLSELNMPVTNGFYLEEPERVIVVSGPNQGGKTTFARSIGQMMHLSRIGLCVPGATAALRPVTAIFTHFEKEENVENGAGKLMDDLVRIKPMLEQADENSFFVINEIFASTTLDDATRISKKVMDKLLRIGAMAVWVTFIDEMASYGPETVSMMSTVRSDATETRTFHIERKAADGLAYAMYIAKKHALSYEQLRGRLEA